MFNYEAEAITAVSRHAKQRETKVSDSTLGRCLLGSEVGAWLRSRERNLFNAKTASARMCSYLCQSVSSRLWVPHQHLTPCIPAPRITGKTQGLEEWGKEDLPEETRAPGFNIPSPAAHSFNTQFHFQIYTRRDEHELYTRLFIIAYLRRTSLLLTDHVAQLFNNSLGPSFSFNSHV